MKFIFVFLFSVLSLFGSIEFQKDYQKALELSKSQGKPLFVMISSPTCPECNYMKKQVFTQKDVSDYIHKNYVAVELDIQDKTIPEQMQFWGIPRFYFSKDGQNVDKKKMGGMKKEQFMSFVKKAE